MTHLHLHTDYSVMDSIIKISELLDRLQEIGHKSVAITDHGTLGGIIDFYFQCKERGIKPILGCEFYWSFLKEDKEVYHIILLAKNYAGFKNLIYLGNKAQENFYKKPRLLVEDFKKAGEGLIGTSGCLNGYLSKHALEHGDIDEEFFRWSEDWFDCFFLEVHDNHISDQEKVNQVFLKYRFEDCVCMNDCHYIYESDEVVHRTLLAVKSRKKLDDPKVFRYNGSGYWIRETHEFDLPEETIQKTDEIAGMVEEYTLGSEDWVLPEIELDEDEEYWSLQDVLHLRGLVSEEYFQRFDYEFGVLQEAGFLSYFKMVSELYAWFKGRFTGWGRGSTGGSLVAYLYGITQIDPLRWNLLFERFLNPGRITMPDIDMDFAPGDRDIAIKFLEKYGDVKQISTYGTFGTKEVINSVSKALGISTRLGDYVPNEAPVPTIKDLMKTRAFVQQVSREGCSQMVDICSRLEGVKKSVGVHAAGVVFSDDLTPVRLSRSGATKGRWSTEWDMYSLEKLKRIKFDVLGVKNLEVVAKVCERVGIEPYSIDLEDSNTYDLICRCETVGVFQWESDGYKRVIKRLHPDNFQELLDLNTLYRPGCLESGMTDQYIRRKFGEEEVRQLHPKLKMKRYGLPLYQEDIIQIAVDLAGFSLSDADFLRKAIGKKEKENFEQIKNEFIRGCREESMLPMDETLRIWEIMEKSSRYTWNKAHSVAYTLVSFATAYLSANHPTEFFCELLNKADSSDRRRVLLCEGRRRGIEFLYPDINRSGEDFDVYDGKILMGFSGIKFVGQKTIEKILRERAGRPFGSLDDLKQRAKVNKKTIEYLQYAGIEHEPSKEEEIKAFGYSVTRSFTSEKWYYPLSSCIGEIIDIHKITTKKGDPMAFLTVEYRDHTGSITVFPGQWKDLQNKLPIGEVLFFKVDDRGVLLGMSSPDLERIKIVVDKAEEFLSFYPSLEGRGNVYDGKTPIASIDIDEETLSFIHEEFGIQDILI